MSCSQEAPDAAALQWSDFAKLLIGNKSVLGGDIVCRHSHEVVVARNDQSAMRLKTTWPKERKQNIVTLRPDCENTLVLLSDFVDFWSYVKLMDNSLLLAFTFLLT